MFLPLHDANPLRVLPFQLVTAAIIALCVASFLWQLGLDEDAVGRSMLAYGMIPASLLGHAELPPEYARIPPILTPISAMFLHAGWLHLIGNMLFLWVFGDNIEDATGHLRFIVFYLATGLAGALVYALAAPDSTVPLVGASAAVSGVLGAYLVLHPRVKILALVFNRIPIRLPAYILLGGWLAYQIVNAVIDESGAIAWSAHLTGFFVGAVAIVPLRRRGVPLFDGNTPH